jgi:hypothetical protein
MRYFVFPPTPDLGPLTSWEVTLFAIIFYVFLACIGLTAFIGFLAFLRHMFSKKGSISKREETIAETGLAIGGILFLLMIFLFVWFETINTVGWIRGSLVFVAFIFALLVFGVFPLNVLNHWIKRGAIKKSTLGLMGISWLLFLFVSLYLVFYLLSGTSIT